MPVKTSYGAENKENFSILAILNTHTHIYIHTHISVHDRKKNPLRMQHEKNMQFRPATMVLYSITMHCGCSLSEEIFNKVQSV